MIDFDLELEGTCAKRVSGSVIDGALYNVRFYGGCVGGLGVISTLIDKIQFEDIYILLKDSPCGARPRSCAAEFVHKLNIFLGEIDE
jgi:hypothetical protein